APGRAEAQRVPGPLGGDALLLRPEGGAGEVLLCLRRGARGSRHAGRAVRGRGAGPDREDAGLPHRAPGRRVLASADGLPPRSPGACAHHRRGGRGPVPADRLAGGGGGVRARDRTREVRAPRSEADASSLVAPRTVSRTVVYFFFRSASAIGL